MTGLTDRVLSYLADCVPNMVVAELKTLATNVTVAAGSTSPSYNIPTKSGYKIAAVTPLVNQPWWGWYTASIGMSNNVPSSVYFRNTHTSAHTNNFYAYVTYIKK